MKPVKKILVVFCLFFLSVFFLESVLPENYTVITVAEAAGKAKINQKKATIYVGDKLELSIEGSTKKVKWSSSDPSVASVNNKGKVTGKKAGKAEITAKVGKKTYKCKVTVKSHFKVDKNKITLDEGSTSNVKLTYTGTNKINCISSDQNVVSCKLNSKKTKLQIEAHKAGTATITVKDKKKDEITIKVVVNSVQTETPEPELQPLVQVKGSTWIHELYGLTIEEANSLLQDKLTGPADGFYYNDYFGVQLNAGGKINWISIFSGTKYSLFNAQLGNGAITVIDIAGCGADKYGWTSPNNLVYPDYLTSEKYPNRLVMLTWNANKKLTAIAYGDI